MKSSVTRFAVATVLLVAVIAAGVLLLGNCNEERLVLFPADTYEVYRVTDSLAGGFSTCELKKDDSLLTARVNIMSGRAYSYAGVGFNMRSANHRPSGNFDFSKYDSVGIQAYSRYISNLQIKLLVEDPQYSKPQVFLSYRPLAKSLTVGPGEMKAALSDFKVQEWWLVAQGLEQDDGLTYLDRGALLEITNGEKTLHGIPDDIEIRSIRLWGENKTLTFAVKAVLALFIVVWLAFVVLNFKLFKKKISDGSR